MGKVNLSIIIPVYNKEIYIKKCLRSILEQSYTQYEVILIDDGSVDHSKEYIQEIAQTDDRIKCFSYANAGVSVARNRGLNQAKGKYILFIDADDWIEPDYFLRIMEKTADSDADLFLWGITKEYPKMEQRYIPDQQGEKKQKEFLQTFVKEQYETKVGLYGYIANKLLKTDVIRKYRLAFDEHVHLLEDYNFFLDYYSHCKSIYVYSESGYHYVMDAENSSIKSIKKVDYRSLLQIHLKCLKLLEDKECLNADNLWHLQHALCDLAVSSFLEMNPVSIKEVHSLLVFLEKKSAIWESLKTQYSRFFVLKRLILCRCKLIIYLYLHVWKLYLNLRNNN